MKIKMKNYTKRFEKLKEKFPEKTEKEIYNLIIKEDIDKNISESDSIIPLFVKSIINK
jgi:hypothetical protein